MDLRFRPLQLPVFRNIDHAQDIHEINIDIFSTFCEYQYVLLLTNVIGLRKGKTLIWSCGSQKVGRGIAKP